MKPIPGFPGYYATTDGEICSMRTGFRRRLTKQIKGGYFHVQVRRGVGRRTQVKMPVHQLVLMAYKGVKPDQSMQGRHLNGKRLNNTPDNLEWGTPKQNTQDSIRHRTAACLRQGECHNASRLTEADVLQIHKEANSGVLQAVLAERYGVNQKHVSDIKLKKTRRHLWQGVG